MTTVKLQECFLCHRKVTVRELFPGESIRPALNEMIQEKVPQWSGKEPLCISCLNEYRTRYVQEALEKEKGELSSLELEVIKSLHEQETLTQDINEQFERQITPGERLADRIAEVGGSWSFLIGFAVVMVAWITLNSQLLSAHPFDAFPFILLNLVLSCLAAVQAPIIMMSQNRQEARDRLRAENDYKVNLKAELEIRHVNLKLDQLLTHQWQRLLEIQQIQMDIMGELAAHNKKR